jgi:hypothetical protein
VYVGVPPASPGWGSVVAGAIVAAVALLAAAVGLVAITCWAPPAPPKPSHKRSAPPAPVAARTGSIDVAGRWHGRISGNDPDVQTELTLEQQGRTVKGRLIWTSAASGVNQRDVAGFVDHARGAVIMHDVDLPVDRANQPWRFCKIDYYLLELKGERNLEGTYWSAACTDQAVVTLER